jgi:hypothetical protein
MATATLPPHTSSAVVWQAPNKGVKDFQFDYTVQNTINRSLLSTTPESVNTAMQLVNMVKHSIANELPQAQHNYKLAKKHLKPLTAIHLFSISLLENVENMQVLNNSVLDTQMNKLVAAVQIVHNEAHYACEMLNMFKALDECETLSGKTYTVKQFKNKFALA